MQGREVSSLSAADIARAVRSRQLSPVEVTETYLGRVARLNPRLHAYITVGADRARAEAREVEERVMAREAVGPLAGVPVAVKDQFWTKGIPTTCGSSLYKDFIPSEDATVVSRLRAAGAVLLGKLHLVLGALEEEESPWEQCLNPWDSARDTGGSSCGSAVALAAELCAASVGEDTGGSGRIPASWCGILGLRPTYGRVSRHGMLPLCWYMDAAAPMARIAEDVALVLQAVAGPDPKDPYASRRPVPDYAAALQLPVRGVRVGVIQELTSSKVDPEVRALLGDAMRVLETLGASVSEVSVPAISLGGATLTTLVNLEAATAYAQVLRAHPTLIRKPARTWLWAKQLLPAALVNDALRARHLLRRQMLNVFQAFDVLLSPTTSTPAPLREAYVAHGAMSEGLGDAVAEWISYLAGHALAGVPAISVPCGFTRGRPPLPVGMQLTGPPFSEGRLLQVAHAYQQATAWHLRRPPIGDP